MESNGEIVRVFPTIKVTWDESKHNVAVQWDSKEFPNPTFVLAALKMAAEAVEEKLKVQRAMSMQQELMGAAQANALASKLAQRG